MKKEVYTLKKKKNTDEYHIFKGEMTDEKTCNANSKSICGKMNLSESSDNNHFNNCLDENRARKRAAEIGRAVCGICVSHLYTTTY